MKIYTALLTGLLFGLGLILSGMTDPSKVLGFLDLAGYWNPSLAFVLGGALLVGMLGVPFATQRSKSLLGEAMRLPAATKIDPRLVLGSMTFGIGWGLSGYCPGAALTSLVQGGIKPFLFTVAMLVGMALFEVLENIKNRSMNTMA